MKRKLLGPVLVSGLVALMGIGLVLAWPRAPLDSALSAPIALPARLVCYGYVDSRHGALLLQPARAGRVMQVFVREGQTVSKDTPLVQLDDRLVKRYEQEAELGVQAAQLQLTRARDGRKQYQAKQEQAKAALQVAENKLRAAQHYLTVKEEVLRDGFSNTGQLDLARDQVDEAKGLVAIARNKLAELNAIDPELEVKLAQVQLDRSQAQLRRAGLEREEMLLKAPVTGSVLRVGAQEGDLVSPASPRPVVWLAPTGEWIVRIEVAQEFAGRVRERLAVQVEDEASAALLARGTIAEVRDCFLPRRQFSMDPTAINTGLVLECLVALEQAHGQLRLGQRVRVRILMDGK